MKIRWIAGLAAAVAMGCGRDRTVSDPRLALLLDVPAHVAPGDEVPVAVTLVNRATDSARVAVEASGALELVVESGDGLELVRQPAETALTSNPDGLVLTPREIRGTGFVWDQRGGDGKPLAPGSYRMRVVLPRRSGDLASPWKPFVIDPPRSGSTTKN
ncbi:MAG TPA: hypothetical protein VLK66_22940 [Longimicrobium sp.]|nr:hypothetical protein [Longimicrobium sp.]